MRRCPYCFQIPESKYAHWTSAKTGVPTIQIMCWCSHCHPFHNQFGFQPATDWAKWEKQWDRFVVQLFREYTRRWTREQRKRFWDRVCDTNPMRGRHLHLPGQMTLDQIAKTKAFNDSNPASKIDVYEDFRPFGP